jgi:hypothetical protein
MNHRESISGFSPTCWNLLQICHGWLHAHESREKPGKSCVLLTGGNEMRIVQRPPQGGIFDFRTRLSAAGNLLSKLPC